MAYSHSDLSDTIVALATPPGVGAIGVLRLSGARAIAIVDGVFKGKKLAKQPGHTAHFGSIRTEDGHLLDEVLVTLFKAPRSYTGEEVVEVSCHGSPYIIRELMALFLRQGARLAQPGEFTLRAFLNGRMDLSQAEAVADLIASGSEASHQLALQQMRGGFSKDIAQLRQQLIDFASLIELELDFSEEDVEFANRQELQTLVERLRSVVRQLAHSFQLGNVLKEGVTTVIAGRPNAGKSTLLNALLNEERAIVSDIPGTTRDTIEEVLNINGVQFRLIDTAGIREAEDAIEAMGVEKTLEKVRQSSLLVYVFDAHALSVAAVQADLQQLQQPGLHVLVVANKVDLVAESELPSALGGLATHTEPPSALGGLATHPDPPSLGRELWGWRTANAASYERLKKFAREMRSKQTRAEKVLWEKVRGRRIGGHKFLRQHIIGYFIADFYCAEKRLVLEVDGPYHQLPEVQLSDAQRTAILESNGIQVLRFSNDEVFNDIEGVVGKIESALNPMPPLPYEGGAVDFPLGWLPISAKAGLNIAELKDRLYEAVVTEAVKPGDTVVSNARHYEALTKAGQALDAVLDGLRNQVTGDFVAQDIRHALHHLGEITGEISSEDLLGNIFGRFCIGK